VFCDLALGYTANRYTCNGFNNCRSNFMSCMESQWTLLACNRWSWSNYTSEILQSKSKSIPFFSYFKVWNAQDSNARQEPLFKIQSFGTVAKLSWRPTCRYHIACSTLSVDPRIHLWDVRRAYLPQVSFCHHQSTT
jgi:hypothetical protein